MTDISLHVDQVTRIYGQGETAGLALLAALGPARRVAAIPPADALRVE